LAIYLEGLCPEVLTMTLSAGFGLIARKLRCLRVMTATAILPALLTLASAPSAVWADPLFGMKTDISTGNLPRWVAIGDLNADRKPDLVVANQMSGTVSVLLGNGDGTFAGKMDLCPGGCPWPVVIGDLNGDGKPDLAAADECSDTVSVMLGSGGGTFGARTGFGTGGHSLAMAIGDLNGDGKLDLVTANGYGSTVTVLLGNGDGTFGMGTDLGTENCPRSVAIGDLNGDGKPDLAVANCGPYEDPGHTVSVLLGNGDGTFDAKTDYGTGGYPVSVAIGDLNADGKPDLATANAFENTVSVLLGAGAGTFAAKTDYGTGIGAFSVGIGDLNADGEPDLAVANYASNAVSVLLGNGDGTFGTKTDYDTGTNAVFVAIGDLNGDCRPDLAVANCGSSTVSVLLNIGTGTTGVAPVPSNLPRTLTLLPSRPSPSRGASEIRFLVPTACPVDAVLFDLAGRKVRTLAVDQLTAPGEQGIHWDGRDGSGVPVRDGVYLVQVRAGRDVGVRKVVILR
jgi:hypothetical protein